jgi:hypothetical protein
VSATTLKSKESKKGISEGKELQKLSIEGIKGKKKG